MKVNPSMWHRRDDTELPYAPQHHTAHMRIEHPAGKEQREFEAEAEAREGTVALSPLQRFGAVLQSNYTHDTASVSIPVIHLGLAALGCVPAALGGGGGTGGYEAPPRGTLSGWTGAGFGHTFMVRVDHCTATPQCRSWRRRE